MTSGNSAHPLVGIAKVRGFFWLVVTVTVHAGLLGYSSLMQAPTVGEIGHMAAGVSHWCFGNFTLYRVNPPLTRLIGTLPVVVMSPKKDWHRASADIAVRTEWAVGEDFIIANGDRARFFFSVARCACIPLSLLGACICGLWARQLYGLGSGYLAVTLWCFCPSILAHGHMLGPDVGAAAVGVAAGYVFWKWLNTPNRRTAFVAGVVLGVAELSKLTWIVLFLVWPALSLLWRLGGSINKRTGDGQEPESGKRPGRCWIPATTIGVILLVAIYLINLGYGFEGTLRKLGEYDFVSLSFAGPRNDIHTVVPGRNRFAGTWLGAIPVPLPENYLMGIDRQKWDFERGLPSYLRGEWADHGWWYYYLYALAIKEPLGTWCLVALAVGVTLFEMFGGRRAVQLTSPSFPAPLPTNLPLVASEGTRFSASSRDEMVVLAPGLVILVLVSSQTGFSVHSRYVIPALPFVFVWTSKIGRVFEIRPFTRKRLVLAATVVLALAWSVSSSLFIYPHSLSYFNELAAILPTPAEATYPRPIGANGDNLVSTIISAGPRNGPRHLLDSNIDWGQDLFYLENWCESHPEARPIKVAYFGSYPLDRSKVKSDGYPPIGPDGERIDDKTGATASGPLPGWYALSVNYLYGRDHQYRYFLNFEPVAMAGYSIYIYHISIDEANRVRRELGLPELAESKSTLGGDHGTGPP